MGAVGTGTVADGFLTMSMGTSGTLYGYSDKPIADPVNGLSGFCSGCSARCSGSDQVVRRSGPHSADHSADLIIGFFYFFFFVLILKLCYDFFLCVRLK